MPNDFQTARWYGAIYEKISDYPKTANTIDNLATQHLGSGPRSLLDVACGTGKLLAEFQNLGRYKLEGIDLDPRMLAVARERLPDVDLHEGDMADLNLGRTFDIVTCLGSSLPAVATIDRLNLTVYRFAGHLKPNGLLIVESFVDREDWEEGRLTANFVDEPDLKIARMARSSRRDDIAVMDFHYLISTPDDVQQFVERHELGLFTDEEYEDAFRGAGLRATQGSAGLLNRKTFIARHKTASTTA